MKVCYNYKKVFDDPIRVRAFGNFMLPMAIELNRVVLFFVLLAITHLVFGGLIAVINQIAGGTRFAIYLGLPYWVSGKLLNLNPDGQKVFPYLRDLVIYLVVFKLFKVRYCKEEMVNDVGKIVFEKVEDGV
ncbi:hypothetical protein IGI86_001838 [Enterococcus sp. AZ188]|uniref:TcpE family conjugal transfer membrane protein n=1 Tax=Enterococcus sp. AZ188 TaxID=2774678 RepID=UPI003D2FA42C